MTILKKRYFISTFILSTLIACSSNTTQEVQTDKIDTQKNQQSSLNEKKTYKTTTEEKTSITNNYSPISINTDSIGRELITRQYLKTQDLYSDEIIVSENDYNKDIYHHIYNTEYILKMDNSIISVNGFIYGYIQGKNDGIDDYVSTFIKDKIFIGSQSRETGMHTLISPSNLDQTLNRIELTTDISQRYVNLGVMGKKIPIIFSRSIEYLTGMNSDRKLRNVDGRSHITIKETELLPTQSLPIYDIEQKVIDSLNNPPKNIDLINWNLHFHHEADATSIKDRIQQNIDQNNTVVIALQETIEQYTTQNIFADQGDKWFYLQTPTYQQYWKNAQAIDNEQKTDTELFNLSRVLASNKPFTDIKYLVMPYTVESYKNYKSAIAGKLDDIWFVVVHLASSSAANGKQLENLKDLIIEKLGNPDRLVIMGDLNQATDDKDVKQFVKELNLSDALPIGATWCNAKNAESNQQHIDHILIKGVAFDKGKIVDTCKQSDHKMVKCTIKL